MSKHTKGPWNYVTADGSIGGIEDAKGNAIGHAFQVAAPERSVVAIYRANQERIANAKLMAAAPELLSALNDLLVGMEASGGWPGDDGLFDAGMAAYKKATGEE